MNEGDVMAEAPMATEKPKLMTVAEVAAYVDRTPTTVYAWIRTGKLATSQPGGPKSPHLIHVVDVDALVEPKKREPPKKPGGDGGAT